MKERDAQNIAIDALAWLAGEDEAMARFLGQSGMDAGDMRDAARDPEFLGFVLDFVLSEDALVMACAQEIGIKPEDIMRTRHYLPGGDAPNWT